MGAKLSTRRRISRLEVELASAEAADVGSIARALLDAASSLRHTPPSESRNDPVGFIERLLVRRGNRLADRAERLAVGAYPRLGATERTDLISRLTSTGRLRAAVPQLLASDAADERLAGIALVAAARDWSFAPQVAGLIDPAFPDQTRRVIDALAASAASLQASPPPSPAVFERALAAVLDAAAHHGVGPSRSVERDVLGVALAMLTPAVRAGHFGRAPSAWLDDASEALQLALRSSLRALPGRIGGLRAFELLVSPALRAAAAERVARTTSMDDIETLAEHAHLARRPARRSAFHARLEAERRATLVDATRDAASHGISTAAARGLPTWLDAIATPPADRASSLEPLLAHNDPVARLNAVTSDVPQLRRDQALDQSEPVAVSAVVRIALPAQRSPAAPLVDADFRGTLRRSPHAAVRRLADRLPARGELHPMAVVAERFALEANRDATLEALAERIETGDADAIALGARLGCSDELLEALAAVLRGGEPRAAAGAARALAGARDPRAGKLLESSLEHDAPRVRANAIEAAAARARRSNTSPKLLRLDDPHHRPASTSIRVQLIAGRADDSTPDRVRGLLSSDEPVRRAAGLWLTERSAAELKPLAGPHWAEIAARVAKSARHGESAAERTRGTRCARRMLAVTTA